MRVWHTVMVAVLPVLSLSSSARVWRVVGFSSTKLFGAWQSWVFSSCIYGIVSSCQNNTNTRKVELKFCVAKGWSKHQFPSKMAGGRRGLVAPQNTFLENIIRRSSQQRKIQWSSFTNYRRLWLLNNLFWEFQRVKIFILKFKGPFKSFGYWWLKLLPGIRVIAESLTQRPRPEPPTPLELHLFKITQRLNGVNRVIWLHQPVNIALLVVASQNGLIEAPY